MGRKGPVLVVPVLAIILEPHPPEPAGDGERDPEQGRKAELKTVIHWKSWFTANRSYFDGAHRSQFETGNKLAKMSTNRAAMPTTAPISDQPNSDPSAAPHDENNATDKKKRRTGGGSKSLKARVMPISKHASVR